MAVDSRQSEVAANPSNETLGSAFAFSNRPVRGGQLPARRPNRFCCGYMKRFTDTTKWRNPWFRKLPPPLKCFWNFICDECDHAGFWKVDLELAEFLIGVKFTQANIFEAFDGRVEECAGGVWRVVPFVEFQYGQLSPANAAHRGVIKILERKGTDVGTFMGDSEAAAQRYRIGKVTRREILIRDNMTCHYCGKIGTFSDLCVDHVIPKASGGDNSDSNLVCACLQCNSRKGSMPAADFFASLTRPINTLNGPFKELKGPKVQDKDKVKDKERGECEGSVDEVSWQRNGISLEVTDMYHKDTRKVLMFLGEVTGMKLSELSGNLDPIDAMLRQPGIETEGVKTMIQRQANMWRDTKQWTFMRPATLFKPELFPGYYDSRQQPVIRVDSKTGRAEKPQWQKNLERI